MIQEFKSICYKKKTTCNFLKINNLNYFRLDMKISLAMKIYTIISQLKNIKRINRHKINRFLLMILNSKKKRRAATMFIQLNSQTNRIKDKMNNKN